MNIALGALIIILLLIPAITFKFAIRSNSELRELTSTNSLADALWLLIIVPLCIHLVLLFSLELLGFEIRYDLILGLIKDESFSVGNNKDFNIDLRNFILYLIMSFTIAFFSGRLLVKLVASESYGIKPWFIRVIGYRNQWCRLFNGQILGVSGEVDDMQEEIDIISIDILTEHNPLPILYSGLFVNYYLKKTSNDLDVIILQSPYKRHVVQTNSPDEISADSFSEAEEIHGDYFIIPAEKIINININYYSFPDLEEDQVIDDKYNPADPDEEGDLNQMVNVLEN